MNCNANTNFSVPNKPSYSASPWLLGWLGPGKVTDILKCRNLSPFFYNKTPLSLKTDAVIVQQNAFKNSLHVTSYTHILIHTYKNMYASATENLIKKYLQLMIQTFSPYVTYYSRWRFKNSKQSRISQMVP